MQQLAETGERAIQGSVIVDASASEVWSAWTTDAGIRAWFAPECRVDLRVGGPYEMYFLLDNPPGARGGEGNVILAFQPERMLSFSWNAPPQLADVRDQRTHVVVRFDPVDQQRTRVSLHHDGWGDGGQWDEAFEYFRRAWLEMVLPNLTTHFASAST